MKDSEALWVNGRVEEDVKTTMDPYTCLTLLPLPPTPWVLTTGSGGGNHRGFE